MPFSDPFILLLILPLALLSQALLPAGRLRDGALLAVSLLAAWAADHLWAVVLWVTAMNAGFGWLVQPKRFPRAGRWWLVVALLANIGVLAGYKYRGDLTHLLAELGLLAPPPVYAAPPHLPLGLSFLIFMGLAYVLDVRLGLAKRLLSPWRLLQFLAFWPIATNGPITRPRELDRQWDGRRVTSEGLVIGGRRVLLGLAKKVLIADQLAPLATAAFAAPAGDLSAAAAWLGLLAYGLQLYFDFSGYSDMAIGFGRMSGLTLPENFRHPYASRSLTELWQRWHMTLGTWLRDYLFFPLAGRKPGVWRVRACLLAVFMVCGVWHGSGATFLVWGLWNGAVLMTERGPLGTWLERHVVLARLWTLAAWSIGLVIFASASLPAAGGYFATLLSGNGAIGVTRLVDGLGWALLAVGVVGSVPSLAALAGRLPSRVAAVTGDVALTMVGVAALAVALSRAGSSFLYAQF
jgi:alginate O-acetyltransferase complex protein AlgI